LANSWGALGRHRRSAAVAVAGIATFVNLYTPQAILPELAAAFRIAPAATGQAITAPLIAVALVAPFAGAISDRLGRKKLIVGAAFGIIVPTLLVATAESYAALLVWRFLQGLLLPFIFAVVIAYIGDECEGPDAIRAAGAYSAGAILGGFGGRAVAGLAAELSGWRVGFAAVAAVTATCAGFVAIALPREQRFRPQRGGLRAALRGWREHVTNLRLWGTCAVGFGMLFSVVATFTFINFRLSAPPFNLRPGVLALVFGVYLVGVVTTPLATRFAVQTGRARMALLVGTVAFAGELLTLLPSLASVVIGLAAIAAGLFVAQALAIGFVGVAVRQARSSAVGLYVTIYYAGGALGGVVPAVVLHHGGWTACVVLLCAVIAAMTATAVLTFRQARA
jgi:predicted MFS family arabinose efflux permease